MADILIKKYKATCDGTTVSGPLIAGPEGLAVGVKDHAEGFFRRRTVFRPQYWIVRWDDVTGYEITEPRSELLAGSTINAHKAILTVKTATTQHSFSLNYTDPVRVRNRLGPYLAQVDARRAAAG